MVRVGVGSSVRFGLGLWLGWSGVVVMVRVGTRVGTRFGVSVSSWSWV